MKITVQQRFQPNWHLAYALFSSFDVGLTQKSMKI